MLGAVHCNTLAETRKRDHGIVFCDPSGGLGRSLQVVYSKRTNCAAAAEALAHVYVSQVVL